MANRFILNELSYFGAGARKELPGVVDRLGFKKALVVTDKGLVKFGVCKMVTDVMDEAGIPYEIYDEVVPNPTVTNVKNGVKALADAKADFLVAIGGGSSMDTAKGIGIVTNNVQRRGQPRGRSSYQEEDRTYHRIPNHRRYCCRDHHQLRYYR